MTRRQLNHTPTPPPQRSTRARWNACTRGELPAETLTTQDREDLVCQLHEAGWTDPQIATHCRMTLHTTARIRARIGLKANQHNQ